MRNWPLSFPFVLLGTGGLVIGASALPASAQQAANAPAAHEHQAQAPSSKAAGDKSPAAASGATTSGSTPVASNAVSAAPNAQASSPNAQPTATPVATGKELEGKPRDAVSPAESVAKTTPATANVTPPQANPSTAATPAAGAPATTETANATKAAAEPSSPPVATVVPAAVKIEPVSVKTKWETQFYGYVELDIVHDSTQGFSISPGYSTIARPGTYRGDHGQTAFDIRSTRFGFKFVSPVVNEFKVTGIVETDFWGNQPLPAPQYPSSTGVTEQQYYINPILRIRHAALKLEDPYVDVLAGLYWNLFGWHLNFIPVGVDGYAFPGGGINRSEQVRLSHLFKSDAVNIEIAAAAVKPPQRTASIPEGQAGIRLEIPSWTGVVSFPQFSFPTKAQIGVSGVARAFELPEHVPIPTSTRKSSGQGLSLDVKIPFFGGTPKDKRNAATIYGTYITGKGIGDLLPVTGGANINPVTATAPAGATATYAQNIDNGIVAWDPVNLKYVPIQWTTYLIGAQYHDPFIGKLWISGNYGAAKSNNIKSLFPALSGTGVVGPTGIVPKYRYWAVNAACEITDALRVGVAYAQYTNTYADDKTAKDSRVILSFYYSFI